MIKHLTYSKGLNVLILCCILLPFFNTSLKGQNRKKIGAGIWIEERDLKANKISSITFTEYEYKTKKNISKIGKIDKVAFYDSLGRSTETRFYNDSTGQLSAKHIVFYEGASRDYNRIEWYNDKDSLRNVTFPKDMSTAQLSMAFGYYKYVYGAKGLISEAVYYHNECGPCSKPKMIPRRLVKLTYTFYQ